MGLFRAVGQECSVTGLCTGRRRFRRHRSEHSAWGPGHRWYQSLVAGILKQGVTTLALPNRASVQSYLPKGEHKVPNLTHLDDSGAARMVDVTNKSVTEREAHAEARVMMQAETLAMIVAGDHPKGDVLATARIAGIMAAKKTHELIPLCHALNLTSVNVTLCPDEQGTSLRVQARCKLAGRTGVEMEALTAVSVAALTVYDMCKAVDRGMEITGVRLLEKKGGRSGNWAASRPAGA